jgi:hypothetical protein
MKWIKVKDRMPHIDKKKCEFTTKEVLLFHPFKRMDGTLSNIIYVGYWDNLNKRWICGWGGMLTAWAYNVTMEEFELKKFQVTYWMPLPETPNSSNIQE